MNQQSEGRYEKNKLTKEIFQMNDLSDRIIKDIPSGNEVCLYWFGGMGYIIKNKNHTIGLDIYLSDSCRNEKGDFKRLIPPPVKPQELKLDFLIATHDHGDHFDIGSIPLLLNEKTNTLLIGPVSVIESSKKMNINESKLIKLDRNETKSFNEIIFTGVFADHGKYSTDCIGIIINISKKSVYFTSDTCYRPDLPELIPIKDDIDVLIVPINGKFGNPDAKDASYITAWVKPKIVIPSHFWLFKEHGGDPGQFVDYCSVIAPDSRIEVLAIGEKFTF